MFRSVLSSIMTENGPDQHRSITAKQHFTIIVVFILLRRKFFAIPRKLTRDEGREMVGDDGWQIMLGHEVSKHYLHCRGRLWDVRRFCFEESRHRNVILRSAREAWRRTRLTQTHSHRVNKSRTMHGTLPASTLL